MKPEKPIFKKYPVQYGKIQQGKELYSTISSKHYFTILICWILLFFNNTGENADKETINLWQKQRGLQELKEFGKSP